MDLTDCNSTRLLMLDGFSKILEMTYSTVLPKMHSMQTHQGSIAQKFVNKLLTSQRTLSVPEVTHSCLQQQQHTIFMDIKKNRKSSWCYFS
jgi:hypothetical protein